MGYCITRPILTSTKKWRQFLDFERSGKGVFWKRWKSTLLEKSISKPFSKLGFFKFCRHFCLHGIHELNPELDIFISVDGGHVDFRYARTLRVLAPKIKTFIDLFVEVLSKWFTKIYNEPVNQCNRIMAAIFGFSEIRKTGFMCDPKIVHFSYYFKTFYKNTIYDLLPTSFSLFFFLFLFFFNTLKYNTLYHYNHLSIVSIHIYV